MPIERDSIEIKTVIPYPSSKGAEDKEVTKISAPRKTLEEIPLFVQKYDNVILTSVCISVVLLFLMLIYTRNSKEKSSLTTKYLDMGKHKDSQVFLEGFSLLQHLLNYFVYATLIYYIVVSNSSYSGWEVFGILSLTLFSFIGLRTILIGLTGYFVNNTRIVIGHHGIARFFNKLLSMLFFPLIIVILFYPKEAYTLVFYTSLVLLLIKVILQLYFVYKLLKSIKFSKIHSFLYLCTLELLPFVYVAVLIDFLMNNH
ncbi:DUF4271 domain-containing protein [Balneicella halophila]|uniref:DUF4271 domain-containing protein n=1 Tax=Balneicella halophila TaxID=1537566 RepID=UPI000E300FBF|nr:DUF4271 domain-containing protein [Balneicella halophila]